MKHYLLCQKCHFNIFFGYFQIISYSVHFLPGLQTYFICWLESVIMSTNCCDPGSGLRPAALLLSKHCRWSFCRSLLCQQLLFLDSENRILEYQDFSMSDPQRSRHIKKQVTLCGCRHAFMIKFSSLKQNYVLVVCIFTVRNGTLRIFTLCINLNLMQ